LHAIACAKTQFHDQPAAGTQNARRIGDDSFINVEAGLATEKGDVRLPIADFALQTLALGERNIRRVRHNQVYAVGRDGVQNIGNHDVNARAQAAGVFGG
jgi:hypothetical protein